MISGDESDHMLRFVSMLGLIPRSCRHDTNNWSVTRRRISLDRLKNGTDVCEPFVISAVPYTCDCASELAEALSFCKAFLGVGGVIMEARQKLSSSYFEL